MQPPASRSREPSSSNEPVRAGALSAYVEGHGLRYVCVTRREIVRRVFVACRDEDWGTVPLSLCDRELERSTTSFSMVVHGRCTRGEIDLDIDCAVVGDQDGAITLRLLARPNTSFAYNRIGICVLLPPHEYAGSTYRAETASGTVVDRLPALVEPQFIEAGVEQALFDPFRAVSFELGRSLDVHLGFSGDEFEMEDQRNWTDASFKIYSTPVRLGRPHRARPGEHIAQSVTLRAARRP